MVHTAIAAAKSSLRRFDAGLLSAIPTLTTTEEKIADDGAKVSAQQSGDLADGLFGLQEAENLVSFISDDVLVH